MDGITTFDIIIGAIVFFLGLKGLIDGFVKEFFGLAGIVGGIYFGSRYAEDVGKWISDNIFFIKNEAALSFVGFIVTLAAIWVGMVVLASVVTKLTHASGAGTINRILGVLFGWTKIFLIFSVLVYAASSIEFTKKIIQKYTKDSALYPLMIKAGGTIIKLKPEDFVAPKMQQTQSKALEKEGEEVTKEVTKEVIEKALKPKGEIH